MSVERARELFPTREELLSVQGAEPQNPRTGRRKQNHFGAPETALDRRGKSWVMQKTLSDCRDFRRVLGRECS